MQTVANAVHDSLEDLALTSPPNRFRRAHFSSTIVSGMESIELIFPPPPPGFQQGGWVPTIVVRERESEIELAFPDDSSSGPNGHHYTRFAAEADRDHKTYVFILAVACCGILGEPLHYSLLRTARGWEHVRNRNSARYFYIGRKDTATHGQLADQSQRLIGSRGGGAYVLSAGVRVNLEPHIAAPLLEWAKLSSILSNMRAIIEPEASPPNTLLPSQPSVMVESARYPSSGEQLIILSDAHHIASPVQGRIECRSVQNEANQQRTVDKARLCLTLGSRQTSWITLDDAGITRVGDTDTVLRYAPGSIESRINEPPVVPEDVQVFCNALRQDEQLRFRHHNSAMVGLLGYTPRLTDQEDGLRITLDLYPHDYFAFASTVGAMALPNQFGTHPLTFGEHLRTRYLLTHDPTQEILPFLATGLGVSLLAFTRDNHVLLAVRNPQRVRPRPGHLDVSVVEGVSTANDAPSDSPVRIKKQTDHEARSTDDLWWSDIPDFYKTTFRGCREELGVCSDEIEALKLLAFGVDMDYYQFGFVGAVSLAISAEEVIRRRSRNAPGRHEARQILPIVSSPTAVLRYISEQKLPFWSFGWAAVYYSLVSRFGVADCERAIEEVLHKSPSSPR